MTSSLSKSSSLLSLLKDYFGHSRFRSKEQQDAVSCMVGGKDDVFVSMPTGIVSISEYS